MALQQYTRGVDGTIPVPALLYDDEELLASQDNTGIYDGCVSNSIVFGHHLQPFPRASTSIISSHLYISIHNLNKITQSPEIASPPGWHDPCINPSAILHRCPPSVLPLLCNGFIVHKPNRVLRRVIQVLVKGYCVPICGYGAQRSCFEFAVLVRFDESRYGECVRELGM